MNPYQKTADEMKRQSEGPKRFAKQGAAIGASIGALSFAPMLARAAPLLSQYIPEDLSIKGLSKISPKFGEFIKKSMDSGYDFNEVKDFIGNQVKQSQQASEKEPAKEDRNIIEQYSPELNQFISEKIKGGEDPIKAAALALFQKGTNFEPTIRQIEKDHKTNWSQVVQSIFGSQMMPNSQNVQNQQQPNQGGSGQQALMDILNRINQSLGQ